MNNQIQIYQQFDQIKSAAEALHQSGFFSDVKSVAQAVVKVMAGAELGLPPFASMTGINIIQGKPTLGANVIATLVKNDPRYDYNVKTCNNQECIIEWYESGKVRGQSAFTIQEAQQAGLVNKDNWKKYPSDMLFARAISRGARRFAPGIFGGSPVYTPDELGVDTDPEGYIDAEVIEHEPKLAGASPEQRAAEIIQDFGFEPDPEPAPAQNKVKSLSLAEQLVEDDVFENTFAAVKVLNKLPPEIRGDRNKAELVCKVYRGIRDAGQNDVDTAIEQALDEYKSVK